jgi:hypothetical protein
MDRINKFSIKETQWGDSVERWLRTNMGNAAADRLIEVPNSPVRLNAKRQEMTTNLAVITELRKALSDLIENGAWDKSK